MPRKIYITGDAQGFTDLTDEGDVTVKVSVKRALIAQLANEVSVVSYAKNAGDAISAATSKLSARCSGNSQTATKLKDERKIILKGDVDAEIFFDGSTDVIADVKAKKSECDGEGNVIADTYFKKNEITIGEYNGAPCLYLMRNGKTFRFIGEEV